MRGADVGHAVEGNDRCKDDGDASAPAMHLHHRAHLDSAARQVAQDGFHRIELAEDQKHHDGGARRLDRRLRVAVVEGGLGYADERQDDEPNGPDAKYGGDDQDEVRKPIRHARSARVDLRRSARSGG